MAAKCPEFTGTETCPPGWSQYGLKCYQMQAPTIPLTQTKAVTACEDLWPGGYLASIESECENDFVVELLGQTSGWTQTYLGATDLDTGAPGFGSRLAAAHSGKEEIQLL